MTTLTTTAAPSTPSTALPAVVAALLGRVVLAPDRCSARVDDHLVEADDPHELRRELSGWVYGLLHAGQGPDQADLPFHTRDRGFEQQLVDAVPHRWSTVRVPLLSLTDDTAVVLREGVRVMVSRDRLLTPEPPTSGPPISDTLMPGTPVELRVPSHRTLLSPGFLFVDGTRTSATSSRLLRVYVHLRTGQEALALWRRLVPFLEASGAGYRTKILSAPVMYPRRDAVVVYLDGTSADCAPALAEHLAGAPEVGSGTPAFAHRLAPGVSTAWEPADPRREYQGLSFGQHRAQVLVDTLWEAGETGDPLVDVAVRRFAEANVDLEDPSRNADTGAD